MLYKEKDVFEELNCDSVRESLQKNIISDVQELKSQGIYPKLAVLRIGEDSSQISYENSIIKQSELCGIETQIITFPQNVSQPIIEVALRVVNDDDLVHGILLLRPFPKQIDEEKIKRILNPAKDVDAITDTSIAKTFKANKDVFYQCVALACVEVLNYYKVDIAGKKVTILGRSTTVGKPISLMMLNENASVSICHSKTPMQDQIEACRNADIVILATGITEGYGCEYFKDGQIVLDVGTGVGRDGKIHGDLDINDVMHNSNIKNLRYTPVPGGLGQITTVALLRNVIKGVRNVI